MKNVNKNKRSAFSLIELSIVLIIIGLLIAGVTGGASLIKSAELRSAMSEARGYSVAVNAFYTQFDAYPGDFNIATTSGDLIGDLDGLIEYNNFAAPAVAEGHEAWRDLFAIGAISDALTYGNTTTAQAVPTTNLPASKINNAGWSFDSKGASNYAILTGTTAAVSSAAGDGFSSTNNSSVVFAGIITPTDALSIDRKTDDGLASAGEVQAVGGATCLTYALNAGTYTVSNSGLTCALAFNVDVN